SEISERQDWRSRRRRTHKGETRRSDRSAADTFPREAENSQRRVQHRYGGPPLPSRKRAGHPRHILPPLSFRVLHFQTNPPRQESCGLRSRSGGAPFHRTSDRAIPGVADWSSFHESPLGPDSLKNHSHDLLKPGPERAHRFRLAHAQTVIQELCQEPDPPAARESGRYPELRPPPGRTAAPVPGGVLPPVRPSVRSTAPGRP